MASSIAEKGSLPHVAGRQRDARNGSPLHTDSLGRRRPPLASYLPSFLLIFALWILLSTGSPRQALGLHERPRSQSELAPDVAVHQGGPKDVSALTAAGTVLECFQVAPPVLTPEGSSRQPASYDGSGDSPDARRSSLQKEPCTVTVMEHIFGFSYGKPFVGNYTPPNCTFDRVIMNFTVVSQGRQFDRLAMMFFGDTEVWRTSTAEPTTSPGIRWTFLKDMTEYLYFWKSQQTLIFDLGNLVDDKYTASFNTTLSATFFTADLETGGASPADLIVPISARKGASNQPSHFVLPAEKAVNTISLPRNVNRAVFSVSANGQASEEFWWGNVLERDSLTFGKTGMHLPGLSPFREVQVLIDGNLAGVTWPFPVIFTGGVVPSLHRPIVGLQAFDLREHQIDITPWLPTLCDGAEHSFTIQVAGFKDTEPKATLAQIVQDSWYATGKIFIWRGEEGSVTTGSVPTINITGPEISFTHSVTRNATGFNESLAFDLQVNRTLSIKSNITSQDKTGEVTWSQTLSYSNTARFSNYGYKQINDFNIDGVDAATGPHSSYEVSYAYPLYCDQEMTVSPEGNLTLRADLTEGLRMRVQGRTVFTTGLEAFTNDPKIKDGAEFIGSLLRTTRHGTAAFFQTGDRKSSSGFGATNQVFKFDGLIADTTTDIDNNDEPPHVVELYFRNVTAVNQTLVHDLERVRGEDRTNFTQRPVDEIAASLQLLAIPDTAVAAAAAPESGPYRGGIGGIGGIRGSVNSVDGYPAKMPVRIQVQRP
ncbi:peptide-N4-(N-acetyl-beta-glucosaminyl)asparagine amidase A [Xylariomycetidae sp. FL2044]|nr:peptide-N4-(N-acetyl-beta-glucosaminyl)asparagine amidase A [Xylariomycetidae sp. FL2044]